MKKVLILFVMVFAINVVAQESTLLRLNYEKGAKYQMTINVSQDMGVAGGMNMKMIMGIDITNVDNDTYESEMKFAKMTMNVLAGGQDMSYDSDKSEDELGDMGKMMKTQMDPMMKAVFSVKGNNLGEVLEMKVVPNVPGAGDMGEQTNNVVYPKEAVKVGSTWNMEKESKGMKMNFIYEVKSISQKVVVLDVTGTVSGMAEGTITGSMHVDKKSGVPSKSIINMKMSVSGQEMETKMNAEMKKI